MGLEGRQRGGRWWGDGRRRAALLVPRVGGRRRREKEEKGRRRKKKREKGKRKKKKRKGREGKRELPARFAAAVGHARAASLGRSTTCTRNEKKRAERRMESGVRVREKIPGIKVQGFRRILSSTMKKNLKKYIFSV